MSLTVLDTPIPLFTPPTIWLGVGGTASTYQMNAAGERIFLVFQGGDAFTLDEFSFAVTAVGSNGAATVRVCAVDADGRPGTEYSGGGYTAQAVSITGINSYKVTGLQAAVPAATPYCVTIDYDSGDWTVTTSAGDSTVGTNMPYVGSFDGVSTYAKTLGRGGGIRMGLGGASSAWRRRPSQLLGAFSSLATSFSADTADNPDEIGLAFQVLVPCRLWGLWFNGRMQSAAGTYDLRVFQGVTSPSEFSSMARTLDSDHAATVGNTGAFVNEVQFAATQDLTPGVDYLTTLRSLHGTITLNTRYTVWPSADHKQAAFPSTMRMVTRDGGSGNFTEDTASMPWMVPIISALDDGAGGGTTRAFMLGGA